MYLYTIHTVNKHIILYTIKHTLMYIQCMLHTIHIHIIHYTVCIIYSIHVHVHSFIPDYNLHLNHSETQMDPAPYNH